MAISSSVRAAPEGARRPCSHSCNVRADTPSNKANFACDNPVPSRIDVTDGTLTTRPTLPRFSWRRPSRISLPTARRGVAALTIDFVFDLFEDMGRNGVGNVLCVKRQEPDLPLRETQEVDHADSTPLATACDAPSHLPHTSRTRDNFANPRIRHQRLLQLRVIAVGQVFLNEARTQLRFDKVEHFYY